MASSHALQTSARFFNDTVYTLPADSEEGLRLNAQHSVLVQIVDGRLVLPRVTLKPGDEVLDCATGSGIWLLELAARSSAQVGFTGIDVSPHLFPAARPHNVSFAQHSVLSLPPTYASRFALIHQRLLLGGLLASEWPRALEEHFRVLRPGGWVQLCEIHPRDCTRIGPRTALAVQMNVALLQSRGMEPDCALRLAEWTRDAGFVNVKTLCTRVPLGRGNPYTEPWKATFLALKGPTCSSGIAASEDEYEQAVMDMCEEWEEAGDPYVPYYWVWAQKPLEERLS